MTRHTLSVLVENKPGVLVRIAGLFARRGFNIDSLAVGPTEHEEISRITIVVNCDEHPLEQVTKQLNKLVEVIKIVELEEREAIERELLLVKVKADATTRGQVLETVSLFRAKVVDVSPFSTNGALVLANAQNVDPAAFYQRILRYSAVIVLVGPPLAWGALVVPFSL